MARQPLPAEPNNFAPLTWTWKRFDSLALDELYDVLALRCRVFILEQGAFQDPDGVDRHAWHLLGLDAQGALQAYLRVVDAGVKFDEPSIGRVITSPEWRGRGAGHCLVREGLARCASVWPNRAIRISAQLRLQRFYEEHGFAVTGEAYAEDGIPHIEMLRSFGSA